MLLHWRIGGSRRAVITFPSCFIFCIRKKICIHRVQLALQFDLFAMGRYLGVNEALVSQVLMTRYALQNSCCDNGIFQVLQHRACQIVDLDWDWAPSCCRCWCVYVVHDPCPGSSSRLNDENDTNTSPSIVRVHIMAAGQCFHLVAQVRRGSYSSDATPNRTFRFSKGV